MKLIDNAEEAKNIVNEMITAAKEQGAKKFEMLYTLQKALIYIAEHANKAEPFSNFFLDRWDNIMGWSPRFFDGDQFLDILRDIDQAIINKEK